MIDANIRVQALQAARRICGEWVVEYAGLAPEISRGLSQDAVFVARTLRAMIRGDHDDPVTIEWLREVGLPLGEDPVDLCNEYIQAADVGERLARLSDDLFVVRWQDGWLPYVRHGFRRLFRLALCHTRGDVRQRAEALGVRLREKFHPLTGDVDV